MMPDTNTQYDPFVSASTVSAPKSRITILSARDYLEPQSPPDYIVEPIIEAATVTTVFGESGDGKTLSCSDLIVCAALGLDWIGFPTKQTSVLFIDEETGPRHFRRRMGEVMRGHNADETTPIYSISYARFDLAKDDDCKTLEYLINMIGVRLIVIDALSDVSPGKNENSTDEMKPVLMNLRHIAANTGAAIIVIHHSNKQGGYRGTSSIKADVDLMIKVEKNNDIITFTSNKVRYGAPTTFSAIAEFDNIDPDNKKFRLIPNQITPKRGPTNKYTKAEKFVLLYLFNNGESNSSDITGSIDPYVDPAPKSVSNAISKLKTDRLILRTDNGGVGTSGTYKLTSSGIQEAENL